MRAAASYSTHPFQGWEASAAATAFRRPAVALPTARRRPADGHRIRHLRGHRPRGGGQATGPAAAATRRLGYFSGSSGATRSPRQRHHASQRLLAVVPTSRAGPAVRHTVPASPGAPGQGDSPNSMSIRTVTVGLMSARTPTACAALQLRLQWLLHDGCPLWVFQPTADYLAPGPSRAVGRTVNGNVEDRTVNGALSMTRLSTVRRRIRKLQKRRIVN